MKFSYALTAIFSATAAVAAPVAQVPGAPDAPVPVDAGLLAKLSPDVAALVTGLGLTSLAPGLAGTLVSLSEGLKTRDVAGIPVDANLLSKLSPEGAALVTQLGLTSLPAELVGTLQSLGLGGLGLKTRDAGDIPVDAGLLAKLSPDVAALVSGLGLTSLSPGLASTLITLSEGLKVRADSPVPNIPVDTTFLESLTPEAAALVSSLGLTSISPEVASTLVGLGQGLKTRDVGNIPVDDGLLAKLSPDVAALVTGLGLTSLSPGLAGTLESLSSGLKARDSVIPGAPDASGAPDVPVDEGLLAKLSPDVAALVTGLGLTSLAPGLAGTLISLSEGL